MTDAPSNKTHFRQFVAILRELSPTSIASKSAPALVDVTAVMKISSSTVFTDRPDYSRNLAYTPNNDLLFIDVSSAIFV